MPFSAGKIATLFFVIGWVTWSLYVAVITHEAINNYLSVVVAPGGQPSEIFAPPASVDLSDNLQNTLALIATFFIWFAVVISLWTGSQYLFSILSGVMFIGTYIFYEPMISSGDNDNDGLWVLGLVIIFATIIRVAYDQLRALKQENAPGIRPESVDFNPAP